MSRDGWQHVLLRDVASFGSGATPSRSRQASYFDGGTVPWVKTLDLNNGAIRSTDESVTEIAIEETSLRLHPVGSVLVAMYGGFGQIGRTGVLRVAAATNQAITAVLPAPGRLHPDYLLHVLNYRVQYWRSVASSSRKDPNITKDDVRSFPLQLPPLAEQRAIASAINDAGDLVQELHRLIAKKRAIKQGVMQELLTGRTRLPRFEGEWRRVSLGQLGSFLKGRGVKRDDVRASGVPCIRYGELYTTYSDYTASTVSFVEPSVAATALPIRKGDVLFAGSGETKEEIGMSVAYTGDELAVAGGDIIVLRGAAYDPVFLAALLNTPDVANQKARGGQGDAVVHINWRALAAIEVKMPSFAEQKAIAKVLVDADSEVQALDTRLRSARDVKTGMMQELLTGRTRMPVEAAT